jgi:hypothetical protein
MVRNISVIAAAMFLLLPWVSFAAVTFTPSSGAASYLVSHFVSVDAASFGGGSKYPIITDASGHICQLGNAGSVSSADNLQIGANGGTGYPFPSNPGGTWTVYGSYSAGCATLTWSADGEYTVDLYNDSGFSSLYATGQFCQGSCAPPPPVPLGGATSTLDQAERNLSTGFFLFFVSMFGMIWLLRPRGR